MRHQQAVEELEDQRSAATDPNGAPPHGAISSIGGGSRQAWSAADGAVAALAAAGASGTLPGGGAFHGRLCNVVKISDARYYERQNEWLQVSIQCVKAKTRR